MKTKPIKVKCDHCGKVFPITKILVMNLCDMGISILDSRRICKPCWKNANYGEVTGLVTGQL